MNINQYTSNNINTRITTSNLLESSITYIYAQCELPRPIITLRL